MTSTNWVTKCRWNTGYSADSVEWCPVKPYQNVLVCGTYQLDEKDDQEAKKQRRLGRIYLFTVEPDATELVPVQTIDTSGVLDQKWCYHTFNNYPVLGVVTSEGVLELYRLVDGSRLEIWMKEVIGTDLLALSLDWSAQRNGETNVVVSDSAGRVTVLRVTDCGLELITQRQSHGFEAWIAAFNYWNQDVFYSGGDDCLFKTYDLRFEETVMTNKSHDAGVTSIRSHADVEHQLLTGSYDEAVRLWDTRNLKRAVTEAQVGGGVWRLKWHPARPGPVLAACMYGGFRLLRAGAALAAAAHYREHDSIAYGADWRVADDATIVATCSFYDCKMHISEVTL